jgi:hypothetical protein
LALTPKEQRELNDLLEEAGNLTEEQAERVKELNQLRKKSLKLSAEKLATLKEEAVTAQSILDIENERAGVDTSAYAQRERSRLLAEGLLSIDVMSLENLREKVLSAQSLTKEEEELLKAAGGNLQKLDDTLAAKKLLEASQKKLNKKLGEATGLEKKFNELAADAVTFIHSKQKAQIVFNKLNAAGDALLTKAWKSMIEVALEGDKVLADFRQNMQLGDQYEQNIIGATQSMQSFGVSSTKAAAAQKALITTTTDFTMMNKEQQTSLVTSAAVMGQLGVANADFAQGIQNSTKFMNQGVTQAIQTQGELAATARALGRDQGEFAAQYAKMGPAMAKFGDQGVKAFKDLAHISKITGMEMDKVLGITNKFDTFEGAAEQAGKLNAALGGNMVNAMDLMMTTDPAERFGMIRDSILDAGLSFDDMSYYQQIYYKDALGLADVGDLAMMLSGDMDDLGGATNESSESLIEQKNRAREAAAMQEQFQNVLKEVGTTMLPYVQGLSKMTLWLSKMGPALHILIGLFIAYKVAMALNTAVTLYDNVASMWNTGQKLANTLATGANTVSVRLKTAAETADTRAIGLNAIANKADTIATGANTTANTASGKAKAKMIPTLLAFGAAILMIGAAVYLATTGISNMADAFAKLDPTQLDALSNSLIGLGISLGILMGIIILVGILATGPQLLGILAVAAAFMLMAIGVGIAAAGVGLMAAGFTEMFKVIEVDKLLALTLFFALLLYGAPFMSLAAIALGLLTTALGIFSVALYFMNFKPLIELTSFMSTVNDFEVNKIIMIASAFRDLSDAIEDIPKTKMVLLTAMTATAGMAALSIGSVAAIPAMAAGAAAGTVGALGLGDKKKSGDTTIKQPIVIKFGDTNEVMKEFVINVVGEEVKVVNS